MEVGSEYQYQALAEDRDNDLLRYRLLDGPLGMRLRNEDTQVGGSTSAHWLGTQALKTLVPLYPSPWK